MMHWLLMGGYAAYVWPAYGLLILIFIGLTLGVTWRGRRVRKQLQRWYHVQRHET